MNSRLEGTGAVVAVAVLLGCSDPRAVSGPDAAGASADAAGDASIDCPAVAPPPEYAQLNPMGITLVDVTDLVGPRFHGGRQPGDLVGMGSGVAVADFDGDGDPDVVLARNGHPESPSETGAPSLLLTEPGPDGWWVVEQPAFATLAADIRAIGAAAADFDGDGDVDLFLAAWGPDLLLRNNGDGTFEDITDAAGVRGVEDDLSPGALWVDVNSDGRLDLYVLGFVVGATLGGDPRTANRLYLNRGDSFEEVSLRAGAGGDGASHAVLAADLDADGELELYVANDTFAVEGKFGVTTIDPDVVLDPVHFDQEGVPSYLDRAAQWGVDERNSSMGVALSDLDDDGDDDLYVADYGRNRVQLWDAALQRYVTDGFRFGLRASTPPGVPGPVMVSWGVAFVDFDRDGASELLVVNGDTELVPAGAGWCQTDAYYRAAAPGFPFADATAAVGLPEPLSACSAEQMRNGRGFALADFDGDGDDDAVVAPFAEAYRFFRNDTPSCGRTFVRVRLRGTVSAPDPIGAELRVEDDRGVVSRRPLFGGGQPYTQADRVLELGLDGASGVARATVRWPSGLVQRVEELLVVGGEVELVEPRWLSLSRDEAGVADPAPVLEYIALDAWGEPLGPAGAGRHVVVSRSDGGSAPVTDHGDGRYTAVLVHPAEIRYTVVRIAVDGAVLAPRLIVDYHP